MSTTVYWLQIASAISGLLAAILWFRAAWAKYDPHHLKKDGRSVNIGFATDGKSEDDAFATVGPIKAYLKASNVSNGGGAVCAATAAALQAIATFIQAAAPGG